MVCPFYNEEAIIQASIVEMLGNLATLEEPWELIVVNDGSTDSSSEIVRRLAVSEARLRLVGYERNRGRGFALRTGMQCAKGHIVVTTEIDSSWGPDIAHRIVKVFREHPEVDVVIASPHLRGGGYRKVPLIRVLLSSLGNYIIRAGLNYAVTMNTGMTRGYRREKILALPLEGTGKELHVEIVNKALAFQYRIVEIPAVLEWRTQAARGGARKRKSSSNISATIKSHLMLSALMAPFRYIFALSGVLFAGAAVFLGWAVYRLLTHNVAIFFAITGFFLALFGFLVFAVAVLANQNSLIQRELWRVQARLKEFAERPLP